MRACEANVVRQAGGRAVDLAGADQRRELPVIADRPPVEDRVERQAVAERLDAERDRLVGRLEDGVAGVLDDALVVDIVQCPVARDVRAPQRIQHAPDSFVQDVRECRTAPPDGNTRGRDLQDLAQLAEVAHALGRHVEDERPALRLDLDDAFGLEAQDRLVNGCPADPQLGGERGLRQRLARFELAAEDARADRFGRLLDRRVRVARTQVGHVAHNADSTQYRTLRHASTPTWARRSRCCGGERPKFSELHDIRCWMTEMSAVHGWYRSSDPAAAGAQVFPPYGPRGGLP